MNDITYGLKNYSQKDVWSEQVAYLRPSNSANFVSIVNE